MKKINVILLILFISQLVMGQNPEITNVIEKYRKEITKSMKQNHVVGASVILFDKDGILWKEGFGYSDIENGIKADENTPYGIGSVTKVFTATAIMKLYENKRLNLDDPLKKHLPEFNIKGSNCDEVTIKRIMYHHSGLPSDIFKGMFTDKPEDYKEVVNYMNKEYLAYKPNIIRSYSNPGFSLLGHVIQKISGNEYNDFIEQKIFSKLGMKASHFDAKAEHLSKTYDKKGDYRKDVLIRDIPAGGMYSNASDLQKFGQAILSESDLLLEQKTFSEMFSVVNQDVPLDFGSEYGLSWNTTIKKHVGRIWYHTGTTLYYNAALSISKDAGLGVAILTNSENGGRVYRYASNILRDVAKEYGYNNHANYETDKDKITSPKKRMRLSPKEVEHYTGVYTTPGVVIPIFRKGKKLKTRITGIKAELIPVAKDTFIPRPLLFGFIPIKLGNIRFYFEEVDGYQVLTQKEKGTGKELLASKYEMKETNTAWNNMMGSYRFINQLPGERNIFVDFKIEEVNGIPCLTFLQRGTKKRLTMALDVKSTQLAQVAGLGRYAGTSVEILSNNTIKAFGYELEKKN